MTVLVGRFRKSRQNGGTTMVNFTFFQSNWDPQKIRSDKSLAG